MLICQDLLGSALTDLTILNARVAGFGLFSPNESLDDISTRDLVYLLVPYVCAEVQSRLKTVDKHERVVSITQAQACMGVIYILNNDIAK